MSTQDHLNELDRLRRALKQIAIEHFHARWASRKMREAARRKLEDAKRARFELMKAEWQEEEDDRRAAFPLWAHPAY